MIQPTRAAPTERAMSLLRCLGHCGPLFYDQLLRALPAFTPDLLTKKTSQRLLYRELEALTRAGWVSTRRPPRLRASAYFMTERGSAVLEAQRQERIELTNIEKFCTNTSHEALVRSFLIELVLARKAAKSPLREVGWNLSERFEVPAAAEQSARAYEPDVLAWLTLHAGPSVALLVEIDRGTETLGTWNDKLAKVTAVLPTLGAHARLLVVTEGERRLESLLASTRDQRFEALRGRVRGALAQQVRAETFFNPVFKLPSVPGKQQASATLVEWNARS
jgi:DNA-binding PadR family transcriptional regulator